MKIEDLRIGNLINFDGKHEFISSLHGDSTLRLKKTIDSDCHGCYSIRNKRIQPIPLTEEWLIKFGFTEAEINEKWYYLYKIWICVIDGVICFGDEFKQVNLNIQCKYVHQLQNIYKELTNEELTIKL